MTKIDKLKLFPEYQKLWDACEVRPERKKLIEQIALAVSKNRVRYLNAGKPFGMPWQVVAAIHSLETGRSFSRHLHNGDPLTRRTTHVPAGRPKAGSPPFTWEVSAKDALTMQGAAGIGTWDVPHSLYFLEDYNGWGYRLYHPSTKSPYLWSMTNQYKSGKYVADGKWSETAISQQVGACAILKLIGLS